MGKLGELTKICDFWDLLSKLNALKTIQKNHICIKILFDGTYVLMYSCQTIVN